MTPTPEDIALARKCAVLVADTTEGSIAGRILAGEYDDWPLVTVALTAIMEVRENVATFLDATPHTYTDPISGVNIRTPQVLATAIRNGEHLR